MLYDGGTLEYAGLVQIYQAFEKSGAQSPFIETLRLLDLLSMGELRQLSRELTEHNRLDPHFVAARRREGVPLEYVLGKAIFLGREFRCTRDTLIPRQETELLARVTLGLVDELQSNGETVTAADIGTGCGNIAISVALGADLLRVFACDISPAAVEVAKGNVLRYGLQDRVTVLCGDLFAPLCELGYEGKLDLVVCNPPYIPTSSLQNLAPEVIDYEPRVALDAGTYGIDIFRRLILDSVAMLRPGGRLVFEIGAGQDKLVTRLLQRGRAYRDIQYYDDGVDVRVISATKRTDNSTQGTDHE